MSTMNNQKYDVAIIGGGLTGLTAAIYLARGGKSVIIIEKEKQLGGMARTDILNGAYFNQGPHAMYEGGAAIRILSELAALPDGGYAVKGSMIGIQQGQLIQIPSGITTEESQEWSTLMSGLSQIDTEAIQAVSLEEWAQTYIVHDQVRLLFYAMCRQWAYSDNMRILSAGYVIKQGQLAGKGVRYVEGGWQSVVDGLRTMAVKAGSTILTGNSADRIWLRENTVCGIVFTDGTEIEASSVIAAAGPDEVCRLIEGSEHMSLGKWREVSNPLYGSCLDVALRQLPHPERVFALGMDQPYYFSIHSGSVKLSDNGAKVLHVMKYNDNDRNMDPVQDEKELKELLELLQPGWEQEVVAARFLPNILIAYDSHTIFHNGSGSAPDPIVPEIKGLFVAGDWVGSEGRLADAAMASAKLAALEVLSYS